MLNHYVNKKGIITAIRMSMAAVIAFLIYQHYQWPEGFWAVVTIAILTEVEIKATLIKSLLRFIGTIIGATLGYLSGLLIGHHNAIVFLLFIAIIFLTSYLSSLIRRYQYAFLITGLTFIIVLASSLQTGLLYQVAIYRSIEVSFGIVVTALFTLLALLHKSSPPNNQPSTTATNYHQPHPLITASKITLAAALTFFPWVYWRYPGGFWATISCLVIMEENIKISFNKAWVRFLAHVAAALFGVGSVIILGNQLWLLSIPLTISFFICGMITGSQLKYANIGGTMAVAITIMLLVNPGSDATYHVIWARFFNTLLGIGIGLAILLTKPIQQDKPD